MLLPSRLTWASLKQLSRDITNDIIMERNISDIMQFLLNLEFQKFPLKKNRTEISWEIIVLGNSITLQPSINNLFSYEGFWTNQNIPYFYNVFLNIYIYIYIYI